MTSSTVTIPLLDPDLVLVPILDGVELTEPGRVKPERHGMLGVSDRATLTPRWPDGTTVDAIGLAVGDGPVLWTIPASRPITWPGEAFAVVFDMSPLVT